MHEWNTIVSVSRLDTNQTVSLLTSPSTSNQPIYTLSNSTRNRETLVRKSMGKQTRTVNPSLATPLILHILDESSNRSRIGKPPRLSKVSKYLAIFTFSQRELGPLAGRPLLFFPIQLRNLSITERRQRHYQFINCTISPPTLSIDH